MTEHKNLKNSIKLLILSVAALLFMGTILFHSIEGWSYLDSFYFVSMTATTIGYGDFTPTHALSKILTVIYALTIIPIVLFAFSTIAKYEFEKISSRVKGIEKKQLSQESIIEKSERKIQENRKLLKEQQELIKKQAMQLKKQEKESKENEEKLKGKLKKAEKEIKEQKENLEVVEDIVEDQMAKDLQSKR